MGIILRFIFISFILYWLPPFALEAPFIATIVALYILFTGFDNFFAFMATAFGFVVFDFMRSASPLLAPISLRIVTSFTHSCIA
jgi:hypothetical protein